MSKGGQVGRQQKSGDNRRKALGSTRSAASEYVHVSKRFETKQEAEKERGVGFSRSA